MATMLGRLQGAFKSLHSHDVKYVVIGGIAAIIHGVPRATFDLDILVEATNENVERLLSALQEAGLGTAAMTTAAEVLANEITIFKDRVRIDVQTRTPGLAFADAWAHRQTIEFQNVPFFIASKSDLVAAKRAAGRPQDLADVRILELLDT